MVSIEIHADSPDEAIITLKKLLGSCGPVGADTDSVICFPFGTSIDEACDALKRANVTD